MAISSDFLDDKKDYDKRVKYLLELGIEPTPFNGNTISGQYFDYNNEFAGYSRLNSPFNVMQYGTWKAKDAKDINSGFFSLLHNNFADASQSELIQLTERYIKESKLIADKYEAIDLYQAQYWAVHSKWLGDVLHELKTFSNAENLKILPKDIAIRLIARKHKEFKIDIDAVIKRINAHVKIEVDQLKAKINGRLMRFPDRAKLIFDEYETDFDAIYKDLKFIFSKSLFDDNGDFIKEKLYRELQMVYAYPNANLDDFINKGIHQLVTMAKIEALGQLKTRSNEVEITLRQVAIIHFYKNEPIFKENQDEIAMIYGHKSGQALFKRYDALKELLKHFDASKREIGRWILDFKICEKHLEGEPKNKLQTDIKKLEIAKNDSN